MKALCSISSIEFTVEHFPGSLYSREVMHPVFYIPQKKLLSYLGKYSTPGAFTPVDSYLYFLALLNSTDLVHYRVPVYRGERTASIIAQQMEPLVKCISRINSVQNPAFNFPQFIITPENRYLETIDIMIESCNNAYDEYKNGYVTAQDSQRLIRRELALERLIKNPHRNTRQFGLSISEWAADAGEFPNTPMFEGRKMLGRTISDYWKEIIQIACSGQNYFSINPTHLAELLEHCELNIPFGTIQSHALFKALRTVRDKHKNFLGFDEVDISSKGGNYSFLGEKDGIENANIRAMIQAAPSEEPIRSNYPNTIAYLKALSRWNLAKDSGAAGPTVLGE